MDNIIYTIGYGNRPIEVFLHELQKQPVKFLADIRSYPVSRFRPDYTRNNLEIHLQNAGIRYVFMGNELGGKPKDESLYTAVGKPDYEKIKQTRLFQSGIQRLVKAAALAERTCIMCAELDPLNCHRSRLVGMVLEEMNIKVLHIGTTGAILEQADLSRLKK